MTVGCGPASEEDTELPVPPQPGSETPIAFSGNLSDEGAVTRAEGLETYYHNFKVWAFKNPSQNTIQVVMDGYNVNWIANTANTTSSNTDNWEYVNQQDVGNVEQSIKYWDFSATAYRFFGVAGSTEVNIPKGNYLPVGSANPTAYEISYRSDAGDESSIPYYSHLWYSEGDDYGKPVRLVFIKPVSKVRFIFIFEDPEMAVETELSYPDFRPSNGNSIKMSGKVKVTYSLVGASDSETFSADAEAEGITSLTKDEKVYTVLPTPAGQSSYTMTVSVNGDPKTAVVPAEFMTWLPGYLYTYIFKVHVDGSVTIDNVQSAFTTWIEHSKDDYRVYNW